MGLFDRKRQIPEPTPEPAAMPEVQQYAQPQPEAEPTLAPEPAASTHTNSHGKSMNSGDYGIQKAIELMRNLPADNIPLVVQVVRTTLESTNVDIASIIDDAKQKRARIAGRIDGLRKEIAEYEEEISARRKEIAALEADGTETKTVQERLELAMKPDQIEDKSKPAPHPSESVASRMLANKANGTASAPR